MKKSLFFLFTVTTLAFSACKDNQPEVKGMQSKETTAPTVSPAGAKEERNKQTAMALADALKKHDLNMFFRNCAPGMMDYGDGSSQPMSLDSMKSFLNTWFTAFPDFTWENEKIVADGEWAMIWSENTGTWKGSFMGQKPNGKKFRFQDVDILRFNDEGKITEHHNIQPFSAIAQQVGIKMK